MHPAAPETRTSPSFSYADLRDHPRRGSGPAPRHRPAGATTASETRSLITPLLLGRTRHQLDTRVPLGAAAQRYMFGPSGSGGASATFDAIACLAMGVPWFISGLTQTAAQSRAPRPERARELHRRLGQVGKDHVPEAHGDPVERRVRERQLVRAAHFGLDVGDALLPRATGGPFG
jgi:hypothetical protein